MLHILYNICIDSLQYFLDLPEKKEYIWHVQKGTCVQLNKR